MTIKDYADTWKAALKADKTAATIEGYSRTIDMFLGFLGDQELTTASIMAWRTEIGEKVSITSLSLYCQHIKYFCEFIHAMDKNFDMPDFSIICPDKRKVAKAKRKPYQHVLSCEQVVELLNAYRPKRCHEDIWPRDKAIITCYLTMSCRNTELRFIRPCDLDYTNNRVFLMNTKGGEERYAAFSKAAQKAVDEYLASGYRPTTASDTDPLFGVVRDGEWGMFDRVSMSTMIERKVKKITGMEDVRSHALRHASASFMLTNNVPIDVVQKALGHQNPSTTFIYAKRLTDQQETVGNLFDGYVMA